MSGAKAELTFGKKLSAHLALIKEKTGIPGPIIVGLLAMCILFVCFSFYDVIIVTLVGTVFPIYWSVKAIESPETDDDKQWLTYWVVYSFWRLLDMYSGIILQYIPHYFIIKIVLLIWMMMPNTQGAAIIYNKVITKVYKKLMGLSS